MFTDKFDYLYVEPTSYCALKCPRCPRTYAPQSYTPTHLAIETFQAFLRRPQWSAVKTIEYGGNLGDPIYHPKIREFLIEGRSLYPAISQILHTNGSQSPRWWDATIEVLTASDLVLFSIDGLESTNAIYRKGSQWAWIEHAVRRVASKHKVVWKFIIFKHNQHQILEALKVAQEWGVATFLLVQSNSFYGMWEQNGVDDMAPDYQWARRTIPQNFIESISPRCLSQSMHYLSASGHYSPCCWMNADPEYSFKFKTSSDTSASLSAVLDSQKLLDLKASWDRLEPQTCRSKCGHRPGMDSRSSHDRLVVPLQVGRDDWSQLLESFLGLKT